MASRRKGLWATQILRLVWYTMTKQNSKICSNKFDDMQIEHAQKVVNLEEFMRRIKSLWSACMEIPFLFKYKLKDNAFHNLERHLI